MCSLLQSSSLTWIKRTAPSIKVRFLKDSALEDQQANWSRFEVYKAGVRSRMQLMEPNSTHCVESYPVESHPPYPQGLGCRFSLAEPLQHQTTQRPHSLRPSRSCICNDETGSGRYGMQTILRGSPVAGSRSWLQLPHQTFHSRHGGSGRCQTLRPSRTAPCELDKRPLPRREPPAAMEQELVMARFMRYLRSH